MVAVDPSATWPEHIFEIPLYINVNWGWEKKYYDNEKKIIKDKETENITRKIKIKRGKSTSMRDREW